MSNSNISDDIKEELRRQSLMTYLLRPACTPAGSYYSNKAYIKAKLKSIQNPSIPIPEWLEDRAETTQASSHVVNNKEDIKHKQKDLLTPNVHKSDSTFKMKLAECHRDYCSPSLFSFIFNLDELKSMSYEINCFYNSASLGDSLIVSKVFPGMMAAAFCDGAWVRVQVLSIKDPNSLNVHLLDYGTFNVVERHTLRYIAESFASLSRKCDKASLFGVKPKNGNWSKDALDDFISKTKETECFAVVKGVNKTVVELEIYKDAEKSKSLSKYMIAKGYAEPVEVESGFNGVLV